MKNSVKNLLRGGVLMLAAVFAFAFTQPINQEMVWGQETPNSEPIEVEFESGDYLCNLAIEETCVYLDSSLETPHPQSPNGRFVYTGSRK
ncbi:hypothetical protein ACFSKL_11785 [Belliella marina]|uniref:Uncharacterized protein n=1 Tax=Belliella marina TaxID=1644146 RepID=A0ABW4VLA8_9BACT